MQEFWKKKLRLARYDKKSEFTGRAVMERWKDPEEEPFNENWPRRASFDLEDERMVPELFSRKRVIFKQDMSDRRCHMPGSLFLKENKVNATTTMMVKRASEWVYNESTGALSVWRLDILLEIAK